MGYVNVMSNGKDCDFLREKKTCLKYPTGGRGRVIEAR